MDAGSFTIESQGKREGQPLRWKGRSSSRAVHCECGCAGIDVQGGILQCKQSIRHDKLPLVR